MIYIIILLLVFTTIVNYVVMRMWILFDLFLCVCLFHIYDY